MDIMEILKNDIISVTADEVTEICEPLFKSLDVNYFAYGKIYSDGLAAGLSTNRDWHHCFVKNKYDFVGPMTSNTGISLFENYFPKRAMADLNYFNLHNGITVFSKKENYLEIFDLSSATKDHSKIDFFLNHMDLIYQFLFYFKDKADKLIKRSEKDKLIYPHEMLPKPIKSVTYEDYLNVIKTKRIRFNINTEEVVFSRREYECLSHLAMGKTMKETGSILGISPKTVDIHLTNARVKTNCPTTSKLIALYWTKLSTF
jgi:DNA-binding CsgD family transcriptional regulator